MAKSKAARKRRNRNKKLAAARDAQAGRTQPPKGRNLIALAAITATGGGFHGTKKGAKGYNRRPKHRGSSPASYPEAGY